MEAAPGRGGVASLPLSTNPPPPPTPPQGPVDPPVPNPNKSEGYLALSSLHLLQRRETDSGGPGAAPSPKRRCSERPEHRHFCSFFQTRYFSCLCAAEEPPELLPSSSSQITRQRNATAALRELVVKAGDDGGLQVSTAPSWASPSQL